MRPCPGPPQRRGSAAKLGVDAENDKFHFGPIHPTNQLHVVEYPLTTWAEAPSGFMMRGKYTARMTFTNRSNNITYLDWESAIDVVKAAKVKAAYAVSSAPPPQKTKKRKKHKKHKKH